MNAIWHATYCKEAWRLYDLWLMAAGDFDALEPAVLAVRRNLDEHLKTCAVCKREKPE